MSARARWVFLLPLLVVSACSCESTVVIKPDGGADAGPDAGAPDSGPSLYSDFPPAPVFDDAGTSAVPAGAPGIFADAGVSGTGPCIIEPQAGSLFPQNWLRPRFTFVPLPDENLFELRLHAPGEANDLVVYTTANQWTLPANTWVALSQHIVDQPITVTVRAAVLDGGVLVRGPEAGQAAPFTVAPVAATGSIVYWSPSGTTALKGFLVGEETVHTVLTPQQAGTACVGCHASTPDGLFAGFSASANFSNGGVASVNVLSLDGGTPPSFVTPSAQALLNRTGQQLPHFSAGHWLPGDRVAISMLPVAGLTEIIWTDLEATSQASGIGWGVLNRVGDSNQADDASFDHTGERVLYVSSSGVGSGIIASDGVLRVIPWGARDGGTSVPVHGADDPNYNQYYPVFSPDDLWIAFNRVDAGQSSYNDPLAEVFLVKAGGAVGTAPIRLAANDPPACLGVTSPGLTNSWPRWAPTASQDSNGKTYYWLTFSSNSTGSQRLAGNGSPQLYVTAVVVDASGAVQTYPALYLWNQPASEHNHTPVWDTFQIGPQ